MPGQRASPQPRTRRSAAQPSCKLESEIEFAIDATASLEKLGRDLEQRVPQAKNFCSQFNGWLFLIKESLQKVEVNTNKSLRDELRTQIAELLRNLEWVLSKNRSTTGLSQQQKYPYLAALSRTPYSLQKKLSLFATCPKAIQRRKQLLKAMKRFSEDIDKRKANTGISEPELGIENFDNIPEEFVVYARSLYNTIAPHRFCRAEPENKLPIVANLGLNEWKLIDDDDSDDSDDAYVFRLFFLKHPHQKGKDILSGEWQETQIHVKKKQRSITIEGDSTKPGLSLRPVIENELCSIVAKGNHAPLSFLVYNDTMMLKGSQNTTKLWARDLPSLPLTDLLTINIFSTSRKMKLRLSHLVAKAVWQYYNSNWMSKEWTKNDIQFMFEKDQTDNRPCLFIDEPFLHADLDAGTTEVVEDNAISMITRLHRYPKILALGILLIEIELGMRIEQIRPPEYLDSDGNPNINTDYSTAVDLLDNKQVWDRQETSSRLKEIISSCLNHNAFDSIPRDIESERHALLEKVVLPLDKLFHDTWSGPDTNVRPIPCTDCPSYIPRMSQCQNMQPMDVAQASRTPNEASPAHSSRIESALPKGGYAKDSKKWLQRVDEEFCATLCARRYCPKYEPVRIAVLDTGIDPNHYNKGSIHEYKDFTGSNACDWTDMTGHGSIGINLIVRLFPAAEIYVARVFKRSEVEENTPELIVRAIRHARDTWKVDIITLASGFMEEPSRLRSEIVKAKAEGILVFAAASNHANMERMAFPARMHVHGDVMCMFASDGKVKETKRKISPAPSTLVKYNFALLGEDVDVHFAPGSSRRESGTSISTFIGAAVAGVLLDFSRHDDCKNQIRNPLALKTIAGMSAVFAEMATGGKDNGYDCVAPWKLVDYMDSQNDGPARKRQYVCDTISRSLDRMEQG